MKKIFIFGFFGLLIVACSNDSSFSPLKLLRYKEPLSKIFTGINKIGVISETGETTPILFNGSVYLIHDIGKNFEILDENGGLVHTQNANVEYVSGFVNNGTAYVFGSEWRAHDKILLYYSTDLINWSGPITVYSGDGLKLFNTSVIKRYNDFLMAIEFLEDDFFKTKFLKSDDLVRWTKDGAVMFPQYYTAAPTIRYIAPYHYVFYTSESDPAIHHSYNLNVARSLDLISWQDSNIQVIAASQEPQNNASDLDFVEFNGKLQIYYLNNSQAMQKPLPGAGLIKSEYNGTLKQFAEEFFK